MPKIILLIALFLITNYSYTQVKKNNIVSISTGYNNATISAGMKGLFVQASIARKIVKPISLRFSLGFAKSTNFPKSFNYELAPFKIEDLTLYPFATSNLDLWNLVKDKNYWEIDAFDLTEATNMYCCLNADIKLFKIKKFHLIPQLELII